MDFTFMLPLSNRFGVLVISKYILSIFLGSLSSAEFVSGCVVTTKSHDIDAHTFIQCRAFKITIYVCCPEPMTLALPTPYFMS